MGGPFKGLFGVLDQGFAALPAPLHVQPLPGTQPVMCQRREGDAAERASCVQSKAPKPWLWMALEAQSRQGMAVYVGDCSRPRAKRLGAKIPQAYRQHAMFSTDQYVGYAGGDARGAAPGKQQVSAQHQSHGAFRQHATTAGVPCGARSDAFSKKLAKPIGASKLFICHYNLTRAAA